MENEMDLVQTNQNDCSFWELVSMIVVFTLCILLGLFIFVAGTWYSKAQEYKVISPLQETK